MGSSDGLASTLACSDLSSLLATALAANVIIIHCCYCEICLGLLSEDVVFDSGLASYFHCCNFCCFCLNGMTKTDTNCSS